MRRRFRAFTVVLAAIMAVWGSWWWVRHAYVSPSARPVAGMVANPDICVEPDGTVVNNCSEELAEGEFVLVAPGKTTVTAEQPVTAQADEAEGSGGGGGGGDAEPNPCITPPGAIFSPGCAAPPNSAAVGGGPSGGGGGNGDNVEAEPNPCITPPGAIYAPNCAAPPAK